MSTRLARTPRDVRKKFELNKVRGNQISIFGDSEVFLELRVFSWYLTSLLLTSEQNDQEKFELKEFQFELSKYFNTAIIGYLKKFEESDCSS